MKYYLRTEINTKASKRFQGGRVNIYTEDLWLNSYLHEYSRTICSYLRNIFANKKSQYSGPR